MPSRHPLMNLPNIMTLGRLALVPVFILVFYLPFHWSAICAAVIFLVASLTDFLDGYLARQLDQTSRFGAFLDPVADKLIVAVALVMLVDLHASIWMTLPAVVIISREISVSALREWMAEIGQRTKVAVGMAGKVKTVLQMAAIFILLLEKSHHLLGGNAWVLWLGYVCLYIATIITLWSMWNYLRAAWPELSRGD